MSVKYSVSMKKNPRDPEAPSKAYANLQTRTLSLSQFSEHIATHGSVYGRADIQAVLIQAVDCIREMLLQGYRLDLGDLGAFYLTVDSAGADTLADYNPAVHVKRLKTRWSPGDPFKDLLREAVFEKVLTRREVAYTIYRKNEGEAIVPEEGEGDEDLVA